MARHAPSAHMTYAEYLSQAEPLIEVHRRAEGGRWELLEARAGETMELDSPDARLDVTAVYTNPLSGKTGDS